jgi:hypothetical protein
MTSARARTLAIVAIGLGSLSAASTSPEFNIQVLEVSWARDVVDRTPVNRQAPGSVLPGPLVFRTRLAGRESALQSLRNEGELPIRH